jgi:hypothetical protein
MRLVDFIWTIGPVFRHDTTFHWLDFTVVVAFAAPWLFLFYRNLGDRSLVPANDPYFQKAVADGGHNHGPMRTEGDGVSYAAWVVDGDPGHRPFCYALVVASSSSQSRAVAGTPRAPLWRRRRPAIEDGRMVSGPSSVPSLWCEP